MKLPGEIPLEESVAFLSKYLPSLPARVLDVGCGTGAIAAALISRGYQLQAIDTNAAAVAAACAKSVPAVVATWPDFTPDDPVAILFVRVLHHVADLQTALDRCWRVLPPGGMVLVEDFAYAEMPEAARLWLRAWAQKADAGALLKPDPNRLIAAMLQDRLPESDHELHSANTIDAALRRHFRLDCGEASPYFFRYMAESVLDTSAGYEFVSEMLQEEKKALSAQRLWPLGRRWVAVKVE
jgi:ubiquinone/menaquinone biosynthesis C-methylase UbiE